MWKDIPNYEGIYQINELGEIKRLEIRKDFVIFPEKILKPTIRENGNRQYGLMKNGKLKTFNAHVLVADIFDKNKEFNDLDGEIWKELNDIPGYYISSKGRIKRYRRIYNREDCTYSMFKLLTPNDNGKGYKQLSVKVNGKRVTRYIHRLVAEYFLDNTNNGSEVNHIDADKSNNDMDNLEYCSRQENLEHAMRMNLIKKGAEAPNSKLTNEQVKEIRKTFVKHKQSAVKVGEKYGVQNKTILNIYDGKTYQNV